MAHANAEQQSSLADFELLAEVSQLLTLLDLDGVLERVVNLAVRAVGATKASLFLHHYNRDSWQRLLITRNLDPETSLQVVKSVLDQGLAGWVMQHRQGAIVADTETDERWHIFPDDPNPVRSALCLPLMHDDDVFAVITLVHPEPRHFNEYHLQLITIIANQIAVAIRNAQLFDQMQEQQRQLEAMLHAIPDVLLVASNDGSIRVVNDAAMRLLGAHAQTDVVGRNLHDYLEQDSAFAPLRALFEPAYHSEETWTFETRSDRFRRDFFVTVSAWRDDHGVTSGHVIILRDITTLRDLSRFKGDMLKMASHDLRSPLSLIVGYSDLIGLDIEDPNSPIHDHLEVIRRSTNRMNALLDDLLRVEEIRNSPAELQKPTDFAELVGRVVENLQLLASARLQQVEADILLDELPPITVDPVLVREAMENLVGNAVKYTPEGGRIVVNAWYDDDKVHFMVEDNGIGVSQEDLPRIFEWGFRAKHRSDQPIEGRGLGLSMVKSVLERHGGEVWVESQEGSGSRFGFWLPR